MSQASANIVEHVSTAEPGEFGMDSCQATGRVIANFAWQHLQAAVLFRNRVRALETQHLGEPLGEFFTEVRAYCSACLMSAAASLEALINEFYLAHNTRLRAPAATQSAPLMATQTAPPWPR